MFPELRFGENGQSEMAVAEAERAARAAKMARLKSLRTQSLLAEADLPCTEEIDCSLILAALRECAGSVHGEGI